LVLSVLGSCVDGSKLRYLYSPLAVSNSLQAKCVTYLGSRENTETEELIRTRESCAFGKWEKLKPENCSSEASAPRSFRRDVGKTSRTYCIHVMACSASEEETQKPRRSLSSPSFQLCWCRFGRICKKWVIYKHHWMSLLELL